MDLSRLLIGVLAYNLPHMIRQFYLVGEEVKRSMEWLLKSLIKVGGGMFTWLQGSPWLDTTALSSGERSLRNLVDCWTFGEVLSTKGQNKLSC